MEKSPPINQIIYRKKKNKNKNKNKNHCVHQGLLPFFRLEVEDGVDRGTVEADRQGGPLVDVVVVLLHLGGPALLQDVRLHPQAVLPRELRDRRREAVVRGGAVRRFAHAGRREPRGQRGRLVEERRRCDDQQEEEEV